MQGLAPAAPVLFLPFSPRPNDRPQGLKFLARPVLISMDGTSCGVAPDACVVLGSLVVPVGLIFSLRFRQSLIQSLFFLDEVCDLLSIDAANQPALLGHFSGEMLVGN